MCLRRAIGQEQPLCDVRAVVTDSRSANRRLAKVIFLLERLDEQRDIGLRDEGASAWFEGLPPLRIRATWIRLLSLLAPH